MNARFVENKPVAEMKDAFFESYSHLQKQHDNLQLQHKKLKEAVEVALSYLETLKVQTRDIRWPAQEAIDKIKEKLT